MEWQDEGLVLSNRRHGERDAILEVMTLAHGRHLGLVRGGRSSRQSPALQPGNRVQLTWRARLEDHLGTFTAELLESRSGVVLETAMALHAVSHIAVLLRLLPERQNHPEAYSIANALCALAGDGARLPRFLVNFELLVLRELGFGLDLTCCAATGQKDDLAYVSPKSGRAVSRAAGAPWAERMLSLPEFLIIDAPVESAIPVAEIEQGLMISAYFLDRHVFQPRGLPPSQARARFLEAWRRQQP